MSKALSNFCQLSQGNCVFYKDIKDDNEKVLGDTSNFLITLESEIALKYIMMFEDMQKSSDAVIEIFTKIYVDPTDFLQLIFNLFQNEDIKPFEKRKLQRQYNNIYNKITSFEDLIEKASNIIADIMSSTLVCHKTSCSIERSVSNLREKI